jgi:hypothetical protein
MTLLTTIAGTHDVIEVPTQVKTRRRPRNARLLTSLSGRYMLANRRNAAGDRREFACRIVDISPRDMVLAAPVAGPIGERVIVYTATFGKLQGNILRALSDGFVMSIVVPPEEREKLRAKLAWLATQIQSPETPDPRRHPRIVLPDPIATLTLPDGTSMSCFVIDVSASGAAVSADCFPNIGTPVRIGQAQARVVRIFLEGFAVEFDEPLLDEDAVRVVQVQSVGGRQFVRAPRR